MLRSFIFPQKFIADSFIDIVLCDKSSFVNIAYIMNKKKIEKPAIIIGLRVASIEMCRSVNRNIKIQKNVINE